MGLLKNGRLNLVQKKNLKLGKVTNMSNKKYIHVFSNTYLREVLGVNLFLLIFLSLVFGTSLSNIVSLVFILSIFTIILLYLLGIKREREIVEIASLIEAIKNKNLTSVENTKLNNGLIKLEVKLKELFKKNQEDLANIKMLAQSRTDFLGNVSHELRTPIFTIQGFLETLLNGAIDDPNVNKRFLKKAIKHTHNLDALLNDLIDISMIESGQMRMQPNYFNISEFIDSIVEELESFIGEKKIKIKTKFYDNKIQVFGDKEKIKQVFVNLIRNAIKYSDNGTILIITNEVDEKISVSIQDSGLGISDADLPRIFERFYRVDKARSKDVGGTGLGLAIVKHIVEAHGSKIKVTSKIGKGSTFSFLLRKKQ